MADILSKFVCTALIYPWAEWTDGKPRRAIYGKDFTCKIGSFQAMLHKHGERHGMDVETSQPTAGVVDFVFHKLPKKVAKKRSAKRRGK